MQPGCHLLLGISFPNQHVCEITIFSKLGFQSCWDQSLGTWGESGEGETCHLHQQPSMEKIPAWKSLNKGWFNALTWI